MVNIRTLGDNSNNNANRGNGGPGRPAAPSGAGPRVQRIGNVAYSEQRRDSASNTDLENQQGGAQDYQVFGNGPSPDGSPLPTVGQVLCPKFKWSLRSFIFTIGLIDFLYFIVSLIYNGVKTGDPFEIGGKQLGPSVPTLVALGAKYLPLIQEGQVYRLLVPTIMHAGVTHLLFNLFFQCNVGFRMEEIWGIPRMVFIYFLSGIGGNLLSCLGNPGSVGVGASGCLFGILGGMISFLVINWGQIQGACMSMCNVIMIIVINFIIGATGSVVDNYAHLGGLITGIFLAFAVPKKVGVMETKHTIMRYVGIVLSVVYYAVTIGIVFGDKNLVKK